MPLLTAPEEDPNRLFGFLLFYDEHEELISYVKKARRTLNEISNKYCDIITFERYVLPPAVRAKAKSTYSLKEVATRLGQSEATVIDMIDSGQGNLNRKKNDRGHDSISSNDLRKLGRGIQYSELRAPNRAQCNAIRISLFGDRNDVVLPGFAVSCFLPDGKGPKKANPEAIWYSMKGLKSDDLSDEFQRICNSMRAAYDEHKGADRATVFHRFKKLERKRSLKPIAINWGWAALKWTLKNLGTVMP